MLRQRTAQVPALFDQERRAKILPPFDYGALDAVQAKQAREAAAFINERQRSTTAAILQIGEKLLQMKVALGHGHLTGWLEVEFGWSERSARNYMQAARALGPKTETVAVLPGQHRL